MAITGSCTCLSFREELLQGIHNLDSGGDVFKIALYSAAATLDVNTTAYTTSGEVSGTGYSAGGIALTNRVIGSGVADDRSVRAIAGWETITFSLVTLNCRGALIYNSSKADRAVLVLDFGQTISRVAQDLIVVMPTFDANNALLRV